MPVSVTRPESVSVVILVSAPVSVPVSGPVSAATVDVEEAASASRPGDDSRRPPPGGRGAVRQGGLGGRGRSWKW